jgi:hypothetical protein
MIRQLNEDKNISLNLQVHQIQKLVGVIPGTIISCDKGIVWITESDNPQDYALRPGHSVVIRKKGDVLIEGVNASDLHISYPN